MRLLPLLHSVDREVETTPRRIGAPSPTPPWLRAVLDPLPRLAALLSRHALGAVAQVRHRGREATVPRRYSVRRRRAQWRQDGGCCSGLERGGREGLRVCGRTGGQDRVWEGLCKRCGESRGREGATPRRLLLVEEGTKARRCGVSSCSGRRRRAHYATAAVARGGRGEDTTTRRWLLSLLLEARERGGGEGLGFARAEYQVARRGAGRIFVCPNEAVFQSEAEE
ncbi:hypothetical protein PR202_gb25107 [Eleusine coracana subsp. coracana]|uniref:Uncharacterized protein n=1 Tax=Eleusine coracana subsp. coracana TaxID=191504 RepID=A0AAV5FKH5_ELECO|nr:hypothetical protein PR202_gb25107 [Eleusine coracana subsp. coracana]